MEFARGECVKHRVLGEAIFCSLQGDEAATVKFASLTEGTTTAIVQVKDLKRMGDEAE